MDLVRLSGIVVSTLIGAVLISGVTENLEAASAEGDRSPVAAIQAQLNRPGAIDLLIGSDLTSGRRDHDQF